MSVGLIGGGLAAFVCFGRHLRVGQLLHSELAVVRGLVGPTAANFSDARQSH